jgi:hypothetical protein
MDPHAPPPANPFLAALAEGASMTYLSMLNAGLSNAFDPLPRADSGLGLIASLLNRPLDPDNGAKLCLAMLALGLNPTDEQELPRHQHNIAWHWTSDQLGRHSAPLASLAIATRRECFTTFWTALDSAGWAKIADSALPLALLSDNLPALDAMLLAGVDPNTPCPMALPAAVHCQSPEALQRMIDAGSDLRQALPKERRFKHSETLLDWLITKDGLSVANKAMRDMAVAWASAHPCLGDPMAELAASAFKALADGNKDSARRCILAMGESAVLRRDQQGNSLLYASVCSRNFPETSRLLALGADPFEVSPLGQSAWGALLAFQRQEGGANAWRTRTLTEKANKLIEHIQTKRKYKPIPWALINAQGFSLLESLIATCPIHDFIGHAHSAFALGAHAREPRSNGMDLSCALLFKAICSSDWITPRQRGFASTDDAKQAITDFLTLYPVAHSAPESKAALARHFWDALILDPSTSTIYDKLRAPLSCVDGRDEATLRVLLEGFEQLGREGHPAPDFSLIPPHVSRSVDSACRDSILSWHERGSLSAGCGASGKPAAGPSRI